jgi:hypothetical protein
LLFFLLDLATELDLSATYAVDEASDPRGVKAYDPRMMVLQLLHACWVGIPLLPADRAGLLGGCRIPGAYRQPAARPQKDQ